MARVWYAYDSVGNPFSLSSYRLQSTVPVCRDGATICAILAHDGGISPEFISENLKKYIANGLSNSVAEPTTPAGSKFYVYMKNLSK